MINNKKGFKFKGIHTNDMDVTFSTDSRPILPEQKVYSYDVPSVDFEYDMTPERPRYKTRSFSVVLYVQGDHLDEIHQKVARVSNWLQGKGELIFDDTLDVKWDARVVSDVGMALEAQGHAARLTVVFKVGCGEATFNVANGLVLGDELRIESAIPCDTDGKWNIPLVAGNNRVRIMNIGNFPVRPRIYLPEGVTRFNIRVNDTYLECRDMKTDTIIDCDRYMITNDAGDNLLPCLNNGNFPELLANSNVADVYVDVPCLMKVAFAPRTLHEFTFEDLDWGE